MTHRLDKRRFHEALRERGWYINGVGAWETTLAKTDQQVEDDWIYSVLAGVVCAHEVKVEETKKFLEKHPFTTRPFK